MDEFLIDVPPPTISGSLHLGHVFSYAQMDFIARYQQYRGSKLVYPFCYDNNGLPTEKLGLSHGCKDAFAIRAYSDEMSIGYRETFQKLDMAFSPHSYSTYGTDSISLCYQSFLDLKEKDLIYRAASEYWFCPLTNCSVSEAELDEYGNFERSGAKAILKHGEGWFVNVKQHLPRIREAIDAIDWKPKMFQHRLHRWLDGLAFDWSISRTRGYGIEIPGEVGQRFDTWFTSSLTPQISWASTGKWKENPLAAGPSLKCPVFDVRFQAHDIIRTWALFTIIKSIFHNDQVPWKTLVVSGHALDKDGKKISKTAGNFVPIAKYIEKYGSAGVRFWAAHTTAGTDTNTDEAVMEKGKRLVNKITNARKFLHMRPAEGYSIGVKLQWEEVKAAFMLDFDNYDWNAAITRLTNFFWNTFCGEFIEQSKITPMNGTLVPMFNEINDLFRIFMPSIGADWS
jgi:valyl-tRNA synthetase